MDSGPREYPTVTGEPASKKVKLCAKNGGSASSSSQGYEDQETFSWFQYLIIPESVRALNTYQLHQYKDFTPAEFRAFQNHLIALGIARFADGRDTLQNKSLSTIPPKFYLYFVSRFPTDRLLHLITFSYLNEQIPHYILSGLDFFDLKGNQSKKKYTENPKKTQINFTKFYKTPPLVISPKLRKVFISSKKYWVNKNTDVAESGDLLCNLGFDAASNDARKMFVSSAIRAGLDKPTLALFCASQFVGYPLKSWLQIFSDPESRVLDPDSLVHRDVRTVHTGKDEQQYSLHTSEALENDSGWVWAMDPRSYFHKTWRFLKQIPSQEPDKASQMAFRRQVEKKYGKDAMYFIHDMYCYDTSTSMVYDDERVRKLFGPIETRWRSFSSFFTKEAIFGIMKFGFGSENSIAFPVKCAKSLCKRHFTLTLNILMSDDRRYVAATYQDLKEIVKGPKPAVHDDKSVLAATSNLVPADSTQAHIYGTFRWLSRRPTVVATDNEGVQILVKDLEGKYGPESGGTYYIIHDSYMNFENSVVYTSDAVLEKFGSYKDREALVSKSMSYKALMKFGFQSLLGSSASFELDLAKDGFEFTLSLRLVVSDDARYIVKIIEVKSKREVAEEDRAV